MADIVCVASFTAAAGLVLRWYPSVEEYGWRKHIATASEYRFSTHPYVAEVAPWVAGAAARAQHLIACGEVEQARQMATHRVRRFLGWRRLEPVPVPRLDVDRLLRREGDRG